jgi:hypothetical protein
MSVLLVGLGACCARVLDSPLERAVCRFLWSLRSEQLTVAAGEARLDLTLDQQVELLALLRAFLRWRGAI